MSRVLITGSADGLGREAARQLVRGGHEVILHARDEARARAAMGGVPGAATALAGDLASIARTRELAAAVVRLWPDVVSTSVDPGWVRTRMGGPGAPGEIGPGAETQVWLATSDDPVALQSGRHFHHRRPVETHPAVTDPSVQDGLLAACHELAGTRKRSRGRRPPAALCSHRARS